MNYICITQYGTVMSWGSCDAAALPVMVPPIGQEIVPDVDPLTNSNTFWRYASGVLTDTGEPKFAPEPGLSWDDVTAQWVDLRDLATLKAAKWEAIKLDREAAEYGGFVWDGSTFDSDMGSQQRISGATQLASLTPGFELDWTMKNNTVRTLTAAQMISVGMALGSHVTAQYVKARGLRVDIDAASTKEAVAAIRW